MFEKIKNQAEMLKTSELRYRRLFESARDGILLVDFATGMILDVNQFLIDLLGYSKKDFLKKHLWDIGVFKDVAASKEKFKELQNKKFVHYENLPLENKAGKKIAVEFVSYAYRVSETEIIQLIQCNVRNITERQRLAEVAKKSAERFEVFFNSMLDGILVVDSAGQKFAYANKAIQKMLGYSEAEMKKLGVADIHPKKDLPNVLKQFERQAKGEITVAEDLPVLRKDGSVFYVDVNAGEIEFDNKKYLMGIFRDITERKKIVEELRKSEEHLQFLMENLTDVIYTLDLKTEHYNYISPSVKRVFGYSLAEALKLKPQDVMTPESYRYQLATMKKTLQLPPKDRPESEILELELIHKDGSKFWGEINARFILDDKGAPAGVIGIMRDVTGRKQIENRLKIMFDSSLDAIMTIAPPSWKFTSGNPAAIKLYGVKDEKEFITLGPWNVSPKYQPDGKLSSAKAKEMIGKAIKEGSNFFEWRHKKVRGADFPTTVLLSRVEIKGQILVQATVRDISAQKQAENQLKEKLMELERMNKLMVGRELKMVELKEEIAKLKRK